jgi:hypothetical protein
MSWDTSPLLLEWLFQAQTPTKRIASGHLLKLHNKLKLSTSTHMVWLLNDSMRHIFVLPVKNKLLSLKISSFANVKRKYEAENMKKCVKHNLLCALRNLQPMD